MLSSLSPTTGKHQETCTTGWPDIIVSQDPGLILELDLINLLSYEFPLLEVGYITVILTLDHVPWFRNREAYSVAGKIHLHRQVEDQKKHVI